MSSRTPRSGHSRWAALAAAAAVTFGAGGVLTSAAGSTVSSFVPITPCRLVDTRPAPETVGPRNFPIGANEAYTATVWGTNGNCTIPTGATGLSMNVAIIFPTAASYLTVFPPDAPKPLAANLNWVANQAPTPNAVTAALSADGRVAFYNLTGMVDLAVDVNGYYLPASAGAPGPRGFSAWDTIPSGVTVTGSIVYDGQTSGGIASDGMSVDLPGIAPVELTDDTVNFSVDAAPVAGDSDPTCTGNPKTPTAPPGNVCIYLIGALEVATTTLTGSAGYLATRTFIVSWMPTVTTGEDEFVYATWAYTAP